MCGLHSFIPTQVAVLADAMFSLNHDDFNGDGHWPRFMQWVYNTNDPTGASVNEVQGLRTSFGTSSHGPPPPGATPLRGVR